MEVGPKEMEIVGNKLDALLKKAGQANRYQILMGFLFSLEFMFLQFFEHGVTFLESKPFVYVHGSTHSVALNSTICESNKNYTIDKNQSSSSIVIDFEIYCESSKIYLINIFFYTGMIIGSCGSYLFADKIGRKLTLNIFIPFHIIVSFLFELARKNLFQNSIYFLYVNLFLLGCFSYIIIITMLIYITEITKQETSPLFVTFVLAGRPLSGLLSSLFFIFTNYDWRHVLSAMACFNILLYVFIYCKICGSPIFALNNEQYPQFAKYLIQLSNRNGKNLVLSDFDFLSPYMSLEERKSTYNKIEKEITNYSADLENNLINKKSTNPESERIVSFYNTENKNALKDEYLIDDEDEKDRPVLSLFGKLKMKDYSPLDLIRFQSQIKNFAILSFLWGVSLIIKNGINLTWKNTTEYNDYYLLIFFTYVSEYFGYYIIYLIYSSNQSAFHKLLISTQLLSFIFLAFSLSSGNQLTYLILVSVIKVLMSCMFLILFIITSLIYPMMIRTKGLGWNTATGILGAIITPFLVENIAESNLVLYYLAFQFFSLTFSYGLPNRIGNMILDVPYKRKTENESYDEKYDQSMNVSRSESMFNFSMKVGK